MPSRPKDIGTAAETAVVRALRRSGFPHAERRALAGVYDLGDVTGIPGVVIEVKGGNRAKTPSDQQISEWLRETETERVNDRAAVGLLVTQRPAVGPTNADRWWAWMPLGTLLYLNGIGTVAAIGAGPPLRMLLHDALPILRGAGYGDPLEPEHEQGDVPDDGRNDDPWTGGGWTPDVVTVREGERVLIPCLGDPPQPRPVPCPREPDCPIVGAHNHYEHP